jgi:hypothetical protein
VGCGDDAIEVPADVLSEARDVMGGSGAGPLILDPADIERLAVLANVEPSVLASVATTLGDRAVWTDAMDGVRRVYEEAPAGVESTLVEVACDATTGSIHTTYQLHYAIYQRVLGFDEEEVDELTTTATPLHLVLYGAGSSDQPEERAAAILTCHALDEANA